MATGFRMRIGILVLIGAFAVSTFAADTSTNGLIAAKTLKCWIRAGFGTTWKDGVPSTSSATYSSDPFFFDSINLKQGTARVIGQAGASDVKVVKSSVGITFVETAGAIITFTTVFFSGPKPDEYTVVDSRHASYLGTQLAEQYYGTCKVMK